MQKKDRILLDVRLLEMINYFAFNAELRNGHRFVAFIRRKERNYRLLKPGTYVTVEMSPRDMSKGHIMTESIK